MKLHIISNFVEKIKSLFKDDVTVEVNYTDKIKTLKKKYGIVKKNTMKDNTPDINNYPTLEKFYKF